MLREAWRVLAGGGRLIIVVPNRRGLWARRDMTPFGYGHPYSAGQLSRLLRDCLFTPAQTTHALFVPPFRWRVLHRSALAWERAGERWFPRFAGSSSSRRPSRSMRYRPCAPPRASASGWRPRCPCGPSAPGAATRHPPNPRRPDRLGALTGWAPVEQEGIVALMAADLDEDSIGGSRIQGMGDVPAPGGRE